MKDKPVAFNPDMLTTLHPKVRHIVEAAMKLGAIVSYKMTNSCYTSRNSYGTPPPWCGEASQKDVTLVYCQWPYFHQDGDRQPTGPELWQLFDAIGITEPYGGEHVQELQVYNHPKLTPAMGMDGRGIVVAVPILHHHFLSSGTTRCQHIWMDGGKLLTDMFG